MDEPGPSCASAAEGLDLTQPVGLTLSSVLGHVTDYDEASHRERSDGGLPARQYLSINDGIDTARH